MTYHLKNIEFYHSNLKPWLSFHKQWMWLAKLFTCSLICFYYCTCVHTSLAADLPWNDKTSSEMRQDRHLLSLGLLVALRMSGVRYHQHLHLIAHQSRTPETPTDTHLNQVKKKKKKVNVFQTRPARMTLPPDWICTFLHRLHSPPQNIIYHTPCCYCGCKQSKHYDAKLVYIYQVHICQLGWWVAYAPQ